MSTGPCYGCRHVGAHRFSTTGHCYGTGNFEPDGYHPGFTCTCTCPDDTDMTEAEFDQAYAAGTPTEVVVP